MTKSNFCVIGVARSRTTLIADALVQAYPDHTHYHEPGLLNGRNSSHLDYAYAKKESEAEIQSFVTSLSVMPNVIGKIVAGATFLDLSLQDLKDIARNSQVIVTTRSFVDAAASYLAAMKTRRFFTNGDIPPPDHLVYNPVIDHGLLFWYTVYYSQAERWSRVLKSLSSDVVEVRYDEVSSYKDVGSRLGLPVNTWTERVKPPYSKPYYDLFLNYRELNADLIKFQRSLSLI